MTTLSAITPVSISQTPEFPLFCPYQLNEDARNDLFVRLPRWKELPYTLRGRVIHACHLRRMIDYALTLITLKHDNLHDARNQHTMAGQSGKGDIHRQYHRRKAMDLRSAAEEARAHAVLLLRAVGAAEYV